MMTKMKILKKNRSKYWKNSITQEENKKTMISKVRGKREKIEEAIQRFI